MAGQPSHLIPLLNGKEEENKIKRKKREKKGLLSHTILSRTPSRGKRRKGSEKKILPTIEEMLHRSKLEEILPIAENK